jgi:hypothetical protein
MAESTSTPSAAQRPAGSTPSAALELYNHIVENANYLICGNENCRQKNFVHQQGRKKTGTAAAESFIARPRADMPSPCASFDAAVAHNRSKI